MNKSILSLNKLNNQLDAADGKQFYTFTFNLLTWSNITINNTFIGLLFYLKFYMVM